MTEKELSRYYYLKKEIEDLQKRINELEETGGVSGIQYREVDVMSTPKNNPIQEKLMLLIDKLTERRISAIEEYLKIESYIESIEEAEIRQIMRYRFMDLKKWDEIDKILHNGKEYSKKKYYNYRDKYIPLYPDKVC